MLVGKKLENASNLLAVLLAGLLDAGLQKEFISKLSCFGLGTSGAKFVWGCLFGTFWMTGLTCAKVLPSFMSLVSLDVTNEDFA